MRTLDECAVMLRELDPDTAVSKHYVRRLAITGEIPTVMCGRKRLINFDKLIEYLNEPHNESATMYSMPTCSGIRKVG